MTTARLCATYLLAWTLAGCGIQESSVNGMDGMPLTLAKGATPMQALRTERLAYTGQEPITEAWLDEQGVQLVADILGTGLFWQHGEMRVGYSGTKAVSIETATLDPSTGVVNLTGISSDPSSHFAAIMDRYVMLVHETQSNNETQREVAKASLDLLAKAFAALAGP